MPVSGVFEPLIILLVLVSCWTFPWRVSHTLKIEHTTINQWVVKKWYNRGNVYKLNAVCYQKTKNINEYKNVYTPTNNKLICKNKYIHTNIHTYIHPCMHTYTYIHIHMNTHTHIHIHTYTYIHIHAQTYTYIHDITYKHTLHTLHTLHYIHYITLQ